MGKVENFNAEPVNFELFKWQVMRVTQPICQMAVKDLDNSGDGLWEEKVRAYQQQMMQ
jgi:hypothetical protein